MQELIDEYIKLGIRLKYLDPAQDAATIRDLKRLKLSTTSAILMACPGRAAYRTVMAQAQSKIEEVRR